MKNKIIPVIALVIVMVFIFTVKSNATVSSTDPSTETGVNVIITLKSTETVYAYKITVADAGGLTFLSASSSAGQSNGSTVNGASTSGVTSLATYIFKVPEVTTTTNYSVKFNVSISTDGESYINMTNTSNVTVKAKEEAPTTPETPPTTTPTTPEKPTVTEPTFTSANKTVYATGDINLRASWSTSSSATKVAKGTQMTLTGTSTNKVNGYVWYKVSYNGQTKYVSSSLVTSTKPEEKTQEDDQNKNEDNNTNTIDTNTVDEGTTTEIDTFGLKTLNIKDTNMSTLFKTDIYEYEISFKDTDKLEIEAVATKEDATIEIVGNEELKDGENTITIIVKSQDGTKVSTYQIKATKTIAATTNKPVDIKVIIYGTIAIAAFIALIGITVYTLKHRKDDEDDIEYGSGYLFNNKDNQNNFFEDDYEEKYNKDNNIEEDENLNDNEEKNPRARKGKHF